MSKKLLSTLIASLFVAVPALAQGADDALAFRGFGTIGGIYNNQSATNGAKLEEYQDLGNGALSNIGIQAKGGKNWIDFYGENFGRTDQFVDARGGSYDLFKYGAFYNSIPHNFAAPALTPYVGVGGGLLTTIFPQSQPANWNSFDLGYKRTDGGGYVEWQSLSPWYFRADGSEVKFDGTKVGAGASGTSPGNGYVDLPFPTQYKTSNWGLEGGYQGKDHTLALRWDYSKFDNAIDTLNWTNPFLGQNLLDASYLPPDNTFNKFTASGSTRNLPWRSVVSARYTWARTTSNVALGANALNKGSVYAPTLASEGTFSGELINQSFALAWTAAPTAGVDSRAYYYWTRLQNKSDLVEYGNAPIQPLAAGLGCGTQPGLVPGSTVVGNCDNMLYSYTKNNFGFDVWWRFARGQRLGGGWDYVDVDQTRVDYDASTWNRLFVEYKNTLLDTLAARLKYTYVDRTSTFLWGNQGVSANDNNYLLRFVSAFDNQDMKGNWLKLTLDWAPMPLVGVSFEGIWKDNDYQRVTLGRTSDRRQEYYLTASYGNASSVRVTGFADWEQVKIPSNHRFIASKVCNAATGPNCFDPSTVPAMAGAYNWSSSAKDANWTVGIGIDWPVNEKLMVKASYLYIETDGSADFQAVDNFGSPINIINFDDTRQQSLNLKAIWSYGPNWSLTLGYAYQKWELSDVGYNGYQYTIPFPAVTNNTRQSYLNGYNAFTNGDQNIFYGLVTYRF